MIDQAELLRRVALHKARRIAEREARADDEKTWKRQATLTLFDIERERALAYHCSALDKLNRKVRAYLERKRLQKARRAIRRGTVFDWEVFQ